MSTAQGFSQTPCVRFVCAALQVGPKAANGPAPSYCQQLALSVNAKLGGATTRPAGDPTVRLTCAHTCSTHPPLPLPVLLGGDHTAGRGMRLSLSLHMSHTRCPAFASCHDLLGRNGSNRPQIDDMV